MLHLGTSKAGPTSVSTSAIRYMQEMTQEMCVSNVYPPLLMGDCFPGLMSVHRKSQPVPLLPSPYDYI